MNKEYKFSHERNETAIQTLQEVEAYLTALAFELDAVAPPTDKQGDHWILAIQARQAVTRLRQDLTESLPTSRPQPELWPVYQH